MTEGPRVNFVMRESSVFHTSEVHKRAVFRTAAGGAGVTTNNDPHRKSTPKPGGEK